MAPTPKPVANARPAEDPAGDPSGYRLEDQIGFVLRQAHQRATGIFNSVMSGYKVTPTQFAALAKLDDLGRVSQNELGRLTGMDPATIWGVVSRLVKQGHVVQSPDPDDARLVMLELTASGRTATAGMKAIGAEVSKETLAGFTDAETEQLISLLNRLGR
ncbi:MarR family winged helix-turn-helix transcriptional regulator [Microbaculum marinum]|uniref:MarR family winged helix-turn-helix transcriptional regulator n=1 Tax=Microbaculum marinum TaxID=1764581 RepID=A0AAW9RMT9_9HYPH